MFQRVAVCPYALQIFCALRGVVGSAGGTVDDAYSAGGSVDATASGELLAGAWPLGVLAVGRGQRGWRWWRWAGYLALVPFASLVAAAAASAALSWA